MYFIFILMLWTVLMESYLINSEFCEYKCKIRYSDDVVASDRKENGNLCSLDNIPSDITMTIKESAKVKVNFSAPKGSCIYKVALVVNSSINNSEDCEKNVFDVDEISSQEVHTTEKSYCIINDDLDNVNKSQELKTLFCQDRKPAMWFSNIFTGCYVLRFKVREDKFAYRGKIFIKTDYVRTPIKVPEFHCKYSSVPDNNSSLEVLTFSTSTSSNVPVSGLQQQIFTLSSLAQSKESDCNKYKEHNVLSQKILTDGKNETVDNCTVTFAENTTVQNVECNFELLSSKNAKFCIMIHILDNRCKRGTGLSPPIQGFIPCAWVQTCSKIETNHSLIVYSGSSPDLGNIVSSEFLWFAIAIIVLMFSSATVGLIFFFYKLRSKNSKCNSSTCSIHLKEEGDTKCLEVEELQYQDNVKKEKGNQKDIILLYTKGSKSFMKMMTDFRKVLERNVNCQVYDWHAPEEWDNVATIGGYEWAAKLFRKNCRVVWIDTFKARSLFALQYSLIDFRASRSRKVKEFGDFRDCVFPAVVDLAKRNLQHIILQYSRHYVVRVEGFENLDEESDPFADLSPHVRYIIPHHLQDLCSHLSMSLVPEEEVQIEENRLRQHLVSNEELQTDLSAYKVC